MQTDKQRVAAAMHAKREYMPINKQIQTEICSLMVKRGSS